MLLESFEACFLDLVLVPWQSVINGVPSGRVQDYKWVVC